MRTAIGLALSLVMILESGSAALAEQQPSETPTASPLLCQRIWYIYDASTDDAYDKKLSKAKRQAAFLAAEKAMSDFRKKGCKYKDVQQ
jgi:hypothetical protein